MNIHFLLDRLDELGVVLSARDGRLVIDNASRLTDELRAGLRRHRDELVAALTPVEFHVTVSEDWAAEWPNAVRPGWGNLS